MLLRVSRQFRGGEGGCFARDEKPAADWYVFAPRSSSDEVQAFLRRRAVRVEEAHCTADEICYYFGEHADGALGRAWDAFVTLG